METTVGYKILTDVGNLTPTNTALRVYSVDYTSALSATCIVLHNGLTSGTGTQYLRITSDSQGVGNESWTKGIYFPNGVWIDTGVAGAITMVIGYSRVTA